MATLGWLLSQQVTQLAGNLPSYRSVLVEKIGALRSSVGNLPALEKASEGVKDLEREFAKSDPKAEATAPALRNRGLQTSRSLLRFMSLLRRISRSLNRRGGHSDTARSRGYRAHFRCLHSPPARGVARQKHPSTRLFRRPTRDRRNDGRRGAASKYFLSQLLINSAYSAFIAAALWLFGVPSPIAWGILAALMRFVPYIGSFIAAAPPLLLAAAVEPGWSTSFLTGALSLSRNWPWDRS